MTLVYSKTKKEFLEDCRPGGIDDIIEEEFVRALERPANDSEKRNWGPALDAMYIVISNPSIPNDAGIAIEYEIPNLKNRIDFIVSGLGNDSKMAAVVIELKNWEMAEETSESEWVHTNYFKGRRSRHPSYQAWSYVYYMAQQNSEVVNGNISLHPCAYLTRYSVENGEMTLEDPVYCEYIKEAPLFYKTDRLNLAKYISKWVPKGNGLETLKKLEEGKSAVSPSLQKSMALVLTRTEFFAPIDKQADILDELVAGIYKAKSESQKTVYIVQGGPGTGKSVLALKIMAEVASGECGEPLRPVYTTKTTAPRDGWGGRMVKLSENEKSRYLFIGASKFVDCEENKHPVILVDEAHRLALSSDWYSKGKNQIKEIINAALTSVFFIDEDQSVSFQDIGTVENIKKYARELGAEVIDGDRLTLETQFRCYDSGAFTAWVDDVLGIKSIQDVDTLGLGKYEIEIVDTPKELVDAVKLNRAAGRDSRFLAGYCWDWVTKENKDPDLYDIDLGDDVRFKWNIYRKPWATDEKQLDRAGSIHACQGMDFDYVGVIIGDDLRFDEEKKELVARPESRADNDRTVRGYDRNEETRERGERIIRNTYKILLTRGKCGCAVYCTNPALRDYLKERWRKAKSFDKHLYRSV